LQKPFDVLYGAKGGKMPTIITEVSVRAIIERVQGYVHSRRLRVRDSFLDSDALRSGRCTEQQFARVVHQLAPELKASEVQALAAHYTAVHAKRPQVVEYRKFVRDVDKIFEAGAPDKAEEAWSPVGEHQAACMPSAGAQGEEELQQTLRRMALLARTRGVVFNACFGDRERTNDGPLLCPRSSGKVTVAHFHRHFPFYKELTDKEINSLVKRYKTEAGDVNYLALERDMVVVDAEVAQVTDKPERQLPMAPISARATPRPALRATLASPPPAREAVDGQADPLNAEDVVNKLRDLVAERRLSLGPSFWDFDPLRRGFCSVSQLRTVFTILNIELSQKEVDAIAEKFDDGSGKFSYRPFVLELTQELPPSPTGSSHRPGAAGTLSRRQQLPPEMEAELQEVEARLAKQAYVRQLSLKRSFQDFDRTKMGRVTRRQFQRIMDGIGCGITSAQQDLLFEMYRDKSDASARFTYAPFCASIAMQEPLPGGPGPRPAPGATPGPRSPDLNGDIRRTVATSRYFDQNGDIRPIPCGSLSARPFTR